MHAVILLILVVMGGHAVYRPGLPSKVERAYLCDEIAISKRQGHFRNALSKANPRTSCITIPDTLSGNVMGYLRDELRNAAGSAFDVFYESRGEARKRAGTLSACLRASKTRTDGTPIDRDTCLFKHRAQNGNPNTFCLAMTNPVYAYVTVMRVVGCKYSV